MSDGMPVRVRFAPSPTGALHIGGARTAYFNWLFARQHKGTFVLRIDDTDRVRSTEASYLQILESFHWLGLNWDEGPDVGGPFGPYRQSERLDIYREELHRLLSEDKVYPCFCSPEQLAADREEAQKQGETPRYAGRCRHLSPEERAERMAAGQRTAYRLRSPSDGDIVVNDIIRGDVPFSNREIDDFIIWKADGSPTYHFASCVDDMRMHITHVIRAEEHLSNTPRHIVLFEALGAEVPLFAHVPMILAPDRSKLSKRHGATSVEEYRQMGILPNALMNYLLLLGFSLGDDQEIASTEEAIRLFDLERVAKHPAVYDVKKLEWLNGHYFRAIAIDDLVELAWPLLQGQGWVTSDESRERIGWLRTLLQVHQERARNVEELVHNLKYYFETPNSFDEKGVKKHFSAGHAAERLRRAALELDEVTPFTVHQIEYRYRYLSQSLGLKAADLIHPTRLALTGETAGPGLFHIMALQGKTECQQRMIRAASAIEKGEWAASNS